MANGNIDQLNFQVILDDKEFTKRIQADMKLAEQLNASLSDVLDVKMKAEKIRQASAKASAKEQRDAEKLAALKEKTAQQAAKTALAEEKVRTQAERTATAQQRTATEAARTAAAQARAHNALKGQTDELNIQNGIIRAAQQALGAYIGVAGVKLFLDNLVEVTGQFETQRIALRTMLQDAEGAEHLIGQIRDLALVSPFTFSNLAEYAKQLSAYGIPLNEIYDTTKRLADVSAGLGVDMSRIILAYGQIRSATVLRGTELRQLTEAGVPILEELAKKLSEVEGRTVSVGEVFDMVSKKAISFEMVRDVFTDLTSEGGKFYRMQEELSESLTGRVSNLKDAFEDMLRTIGEDNSGAMKKAVDGARRMVENYQTIGKVIVGLITTYGTYKAALASVAAYEKIVGFVDKIRLIGMMRKELGLLTATQQAFNIASKANVYIAIGSAIVGVIAALSSFNKKQREAVQASGESARAYDEERKSLEGLFDAAKNETASKEDRKKAIDAINSTYGQYLDGMLTEKSTVEELRGAYDKLSESIRQKYIEEQRAAMTGEQQTAYNAAQATFWGAIEGALNKSGLSAGARGRVAGALQSRISKFAAAWNPLDIYNEVINTIRNAGGKAPGNRAAGDLYKAASEFKETQEELRRSESAFRSFEDGFRSAITSSADAAGAAADKVVYKTEAIAEGIRTTTASIEALEKKAAGAGITDAERKTLESLREDLEQSKKEYKSLTGKEYGKADTGARRAAASESDTRKFYERLRVETERYEMELTAATIDAMDEGTEKALARLDLDHRKREAALVANYNRELETLRSEAEKAGRKFDAETDPQAQALLASYQKGLLAETMTFTTAYAALEKKANEQREENRLEYLQKYGDMEQKRLAITEKYEKQIRKARADSDKYLEQMLIQRRDAELYDLEKEYSGLYALIFADVDALSRSQLAKAVELTQDEIRKATESGDIEKLTELYKRLQEQMRTQAERSNWGPSGIAEGFRWMTQGRDDFDKYTKAGDKKAAEGALIMQSAGVSMIQKGAKELSDAVDGLGGALEEFGGDIGEIGKMLKGLASNTDNIVTAFTSKSKGEVIAAGIASAVDLVSMIGRQLAENKKIQEQWNETVKQCAHEYALLKLQEYEYRETNFLGAAQDPFAKAVAGMKRYGEALELLRMKEAELVDGQVQTGTKKGVSWENIGKGLAAGAGVGAAIGTAVGGWAAGLGTIIGTAIGAVVGGISGLLGGMKEVPVYENLLDKYGSILDKANEENPFALNPQILADYDKLDDATKRLVDNWNEIEKTATDALEEVHATFRDLTGQMGDDLRTQLVDAWKDGRLYDAIDDYRDYVGNVIGGITEQLIFSKVMQPLFDRLAGDMDASFMPGGDEDIRDDLARFADALPDNLDAFAEAMEQARGAFAQIGFDLWKETGTGTGESLGSSIKSSMTEEQAGLVASYLNAMRLDLAIVRGLQQEGWNNVKIISGYIPTLNDYLNQVAANTYNTAEEARRIAEQNASILSELRSVIGAPGTSGMVVRTESY